MICLPETRKLKNDNRGMSLVETLVAIAILSVAIGPLLYMFVFTTKYNAKAKLKQRATNAAVTVMENMKATSLDSFYKQFAIDADTGAHLDPTPFLYNDTGATYSVGSDVSDLNFTGKYWINDMSFSDAGVAGSPKYDVRIDVKNGRIESVTETPVFDKYRDILFEEETDTIGATYDPYYIVDNIIRDFDIATDTISTFEISRTIKISVESVDTVVFDYSYAFNINHGASSGTYGYDPADEDKKHLRVTMTIPEYAPASKYDLKNIYFYYYPAYKNAYTTNPDTGVEEDYIISITEDVLELANKSGKEVNLFVSRQLTNKSIATSVLDGKYQLKLKGTADFDSESKFNVYDLLYGENIVHGGSRTLDAISAPSGLNTTKINLVSAKGITENVSLTTDVNVSIYESISSKGYTVDPDSGAVLDSEGAEVDPIVSVDSTLVRFKNL